MQTLPLAMVVGYGDPGETALQGVQYGSPNCVCLGPWSRKPSGLSRNRGVCGVPVLATLRLGFFRRVDGFANSFPNEPPKIVGGAQARSTIVVLLGYALIAVMKECACQMWILVGVDCGAGGRGGAKHVRANTDANCHAGGSLNRRGDCMIGHRLTVVGR